jgi:nucleoside-diphosphate-sugar epimerase
LVTCVEKTSMNGLIIGGTGLISTPITRILLEQGHSVTHFNRGHKQDEFTDVQTIVGDRTDYAEFKKALGEQTFDCVIDMVCYKPYDAKSAVEAFQGNVGQYIFCSTVDVYTKPASRYPITEDAPRQPSKEFMYAYDKAQCEEIFSSAYEQSNFPVTIIRPAYTYREGVGILHTFGWSTDYLERIRIGKPIITHGDGNSFWVACHADDVARAFVNAVSNLETIGKAYHVAGEEWLIWNQYHEIVAKALECKLPELVHIPTDVLYKLAPEQSFWAKVNFQFNNLFDNTAAKRDLDFRYTVNWPQGAKRMIAWLDTNNKIEGSISNTYESVLQAWRKLGF